jgi:hypothetical protein
MIHTASDKPSLFLFSTSDSKKIELYYHDEITTIWRADTTRDWAIYEKDSKFVNNWEGIYLPLPTIQFDCEKPEVILSYIPKQKNRKLHARLEEQSEKITATPPSRCYYCPKRFVSKSKFEYEKHVLNNHSGKLCYPAKIELRLQNLGPQNCLWEI